MGLMEVRRKILLGQENLVPPEYQQVDYIIAPGDQAIVDTGIGGNNDNLRFSLGFNCDRHSNYRGFFTDYQSEIHNCWRVSYNTTSGYFLFCLNTLTGASGSIQIGNTDNQDIFIEMDKQNFKITRNTSSYYATLPTRTGTANNNHIFINSSRTYARTTNDATKWYYFLMWNGDTLIRRFMPAYRKADGKVGFIETVNKVFYPSTGTKDFYLPE